MRYRMKEGFESIRAMESDQKLKKIRLAWDEKLSRDGITLEITGKEKFVFRADANTSVRDMIGSYAGENVKAVHIGYPLGIIVPVSELDEKLGSLFDHNHIIPGSMEVRILFGDTCMLDYISQTLGQLKEESCGRCVLCREAIGQLILIYQDAVNKRGRTSDIDIIQRISFAMKEGAFCAFGQAAGAMSEKFIRDFADEFDAHVKRKVCPAMVCKKFVSYVILGAKCKGCEECLDVCPDGAIEGKKGYIHMIDEYECSQCGKCMDVCEHGAIVTAGTVKPKVPTRLTRVGAWKRR